jgi:hypothetical protein
MQHMGSVGSFLFSALANIFRALVTAKPRAFALAAGQPPTRLPKSVVVQPCTPALLMMKQSRTEDRRLPEARMTSSAGRPAGAGDSRMAPVLPTRRPRATKVAAESKTVAVYFVASPLQYLAAQRVAAHFERDARQVLIWYRPGVASVVKEDEWDAAAYMPWPRWEPLPGPFGRLRRLRQNIREVAALVGSCDLLHIHSAVFDTEAVNYFLRALPKTSGARESHARILPDGIISIRRYPLSAGRLAAQWLRKLRRLVAPELDYWHFAGDRIGSDAPFCDRIYVLPNLPHEYPPEKVVELPPIAPRTRQKRIKARRALVIGQPVVGSGLMLPDKARAVAAQIKHWLAAQGIEEVHYKAHPKDPARELFCDGYREIELDQPLETWMAEQHYDVVVGVRSSALIFAAQIYGECSRIAAFGWDRIAFKSEQERQQMAEAFAACGVDIVMYH